MLDEQKTQVYSYNKKNLINSMFYKIIVHVKKLWIFLY